MMALVKEMLQRSAGRVGSMKISHPAMAGHRLRGDGGGLLQGPHPGGRGPAWFSRSPASTRRRDGDGPEDRAGWQDFEVTNESFQADRAAADPATFVMNLPGAVPLAKLSESDPTTLDVFELCIGGMEIAPPTRSRTTRRPARHVRAAGGEEKQSIDQDFLFALEHGMRRPVAWGSASTACASF